MTIIRPHKILSLRALFEATTYFAFFASIFFGIWLYNAGVSLSHEIERQREALAAARVRNAEIKNELFGQLDTARLEALAKERGLVRDRAPNYFESDPRWLSAAH